MATLHELITKVIPLKGILRIPSYWMRKVLMAIVDAIKAVQTESRNADSKLQSNLDTTKTELQNKDNDLESKKVSMVYFPSSNSILLQDGNGYVQLFGTRSGNNKITVKVKDGVTSVYIFGQRYQIVNGEYTYELDLTKTSYADAFGGIASNGQVNITYISPFVSPNVTSMYNMFYGCSSLTSLDVSGFDTSAVTLMGSMFKDCSSLTSLDLSNFDTSKVTRMAGMFSNCSSLTSLDLSSFDTSAVTNMALMFYNCNKLTSLDVSNFDTSAVTSMGSMFSGCTALRNIKCKQAFKDWCTTNASEIGLTVANITWEIVE